MTSSGLPVYRGYCVPLRCVHAPDQNILTKNMIFSLIANLTQHNARPCVNIVNPPLESQPPSQEGLTKTSAALADCYNIQTKHSATCSELPQQNGWRYIVSVVRAIALCAVYRAVVELFTLRSTSANEEHVFYR